MDYNKAKELLKLQQEASKIKKELSNIHIEAETNWVVMTIDWEMHVVSVKIEDPTILQDQKKLEQSIMEATNKWLKKSQEIAAEKMKWVMWSMWLDIPGM